VAAALEAERKEQEPDTPDVRALLAVGYSRAGASARLEELSALQSGPDGSSGRVSPFPSRPPPNPFLEPPSLDCAVDAGLLQGGAPAAAWTRYDKADPVSILAAVGAAFALSTPLWPAAAGLAVWPASTAVALVGLGAGWLSAKSHAACRLDAQGAWTRTKVRPGTPICPEEAASARGMGFLAWPDVVSAESMEEEGASVLVLADAGGRRIVLRMDKRNEAAIHRIAASFLSVPIRRIQKASAD